MASSVNSHKLHAPVEWAQRKDTVLLAICLEDCKSPKLEITENSLDFSGIGGSEHKPHSCHIDFYMPVDTNNVRRVDSDRRIQLEIGKKESGPFWPRLMKDKGHFWWCKVDFNKWKDEDEPEYDFDGFGQMNPGMDSIDSNFKFTASDDESSVDSDDLPELEAEGVSNDKEGKAEALKQADA